MIFDGSKVTAMVLQWQQTRNIQLLDRIIEDSHALIEAIISGYGIHNREDLIQDAVVKIIFSLPYYSPKRGNIHNYFTTVIRNSSATVYNKDARHDCDELPVSFKGKSIAIQEEDILQELITFARVRFPSLHVKLLDDMVEYVYVALQYDHAGKGRGIVSSLASEYDISRNIAYIVYNSILVYLRQKYKGLCEEPGIPSEFNILTDLRLVVGDEVYSKISIIFADMYIKFP